MTPFEQETIRQANINLVIQVAIAFGALLVALLAISGDAIKDWFYAPRLQVSVQLQPPYCQRLISGTYFRLMVENNSRIAAENVELWIVELRRGTNANSIRIDLVPIPLEWTHTTSSVAPSINPSFHRYCEFGVLVQGQIPDLKLLTRPTPSDDTTRLGPGEYYVHLATTATNSGCQHFHFSFNVPIYYPPTEATTLAEVKLRQVKAWNS
jgi:hypothetical protein